MRRVKENRKKSGKFPMGGSDHFPFFLVNSVHVLIHPDLHHLPSFNLVASRYQFPRVFVGGFPKFVVEIKPCFNSVMQIDTQLIIANMHSVVANKIRLYYHTGLHRA